MLDWLKAILGDNYSDDVDKKVSAEIGKGFVSKADFNTVNEAKKTLEGQITERDKQIEELKKVDAAGMQSKIKELQDANSTAKSEYEANLKKVVLGNKIDTALLSAKAKNAKAVRALLDESKISLDGENVLGLKEQIDAIKKDNDYLFEQTTTTQKGPGNPGGNSTGTKPGDQQPASLADAVGAFYSGQK